MVLPPNPGTSSPTNQPTGSTASTPTSPWDRPTLESALGLRVNSKSTPSATAGKQAAEGRWTERAIAYDLTNRKE